MNPCCCSAEWTQPGTAAASSSEPFEFDSFHLPSRSVDRAEGSPEDTWDTWHTQQQHSSTDTTRPPRSPRTAIRLHCVKHRRGDWAVPDIYYRFRVCHVTVARRTLDSTSQELPYCPIDVYISRLICSKLSMFSFAQFHSFCLSTLTTKLSPLYLQINFHGPQKIEDDIIFVFKLWSSYSLRGFMVLKKTFFV